MKISGIIGKDANGDFGVPIRVAKVSWLDDHHDQMFNYLSSIVTSATNLDKKDAEPWQVFKNILKISIFEINIFVISTKRL